MPDFALFSFLAPKPGTRARELEVANTLEKSFNFWMPATLQKAAENEAGQDAPRRIKGTASLDTPDMVDDEVLQKGLDWEYFLKHGFFKWEHSTLPNAYVGYPDKVETIVLPEGHHATHVEGFLFDNEMAKEIASLADALAKAPGNPRQLGFSVEGSIVERSGNQIAKAIVRNVAITASPCHPDARMEILARSLAGFPEPNTETTSGGAALIPQSIDGQTAVGTLTYDQAVLRVLKRFPDDMTYAAAAAIVDELAKACGTKE